MDWGAEMRRLGELYRAMSDEELLRLAARPGDLTDEAQGVLRTEMASRRLQAEAESGFVAEAGRLAGAGANLVHGVLYGRAARAGDEAGARGEGAGEGDGGADDVP